MKALTATLQNQTPPAAPYTGVSADSQHRTPRNFNAYFVIIPLATALALLTSLECGGSILHPSSLVYGGVLWGWWAAFACVLGKIAPRLSIVRNVSVKAVF